MKTFRLSIVFGFFLVFSLAFASSLETGVIEDDDIGVDLIPTTPINYTEVWVNSSDFWDDLDDPSDILGSLINNDLNWITSSDVPDIWVNETGDTMTGDLNISDANLSLSFFTLGNQMVIDSNTTTAEIDIDKTLTTAQAGTGLRVFSIDVEDDEPSSSSERNSVLLNGISYTNTHDVVDLSSASTYTKRLYQGSMQFARDINFKGNRPAFAPTMSNILFGFSYIDSGSNLINGSFDGKGINFANMIFQASLNSAPKMNFTGTENIDIQNTGVSIPLSTSSSSLAYAGAGKTLSSTSIGLETTVANAPLLVLSEPTATANILSYGIKSTVTGGTDGDSIAYGSWLSVSGADENYGLWVDAGDVVFMDNLNVSGNITGNQIYGEMFIDEDNMSLVEFFGQDVYSNITINQSVGEVNGFFYTNGYLTALVDGLYRINFPTSFSGQTGSVHGVSIGINGVKQHNCYIQRKLGSVDVGAAGGSCFIRLVIGNNVSLLMADEDVTQNDVTMVSSNLNLVRVGN